MRLTAIALLTTSLALAAPAPKDAKAPLYYTTRVGDKFVWECRTTDGVTEGTVTITAVEKTADGWLVSETQPMGKGTLTSKLLVSEKGLAVVSVGKKVYDAPRPLLPLPAKPGHTWEGHVEPGGPLLKSVNKIVGEEKVEVPAGTFKAVRINAVVTFDTCEATTSRWYAPGVGLVKFVGSSDGLPVTRVLKSVTPGK